MNNHIPRFLNLDVSFYIRMDYWHNLVAMTTYPSIALRIELRILFELLQNPRGISSQSSNSNIHRDSNNQCWLICRHFSVPCSRQKNQIQHATFYGIWLKITDLLFCLEGQQNIFKVEPEKKFEELDYEGWRLKQLLVLKKTESQGTQTASTDGL